MWEYQKRKINDLVCASYRLKIVILDLKKVKVKVSRYRPGVPQRVPGS
jgi:hypothetical protein